jgi:flagellar L-ring protein precursor FlgH
MSIQAKNCAQRLSGLELFVLTTSKMLKKTASIRRPLFSLSGLFGLSGNWLNETIQMNQANQIIKINQFEHLAVVAMLTVAVLSYGCASSSTKVVSTLTVPSLPAPKTLGSLWQEENGRAYLYEDMRAMRVGDILTIKIIENHKGSKSADTSAERDSTINNSLTGSAIGYIGIPGIRLGGEARRGLGIDASASNKFEGKGTTNREGTLTGTISSVVTEVLPNGDLRIEGRREVTVNSEKQLMTIAGIVRRVDVNTKNTVFSSAIADAKIEYSGLGVLGDIQRPGWLVRILDWISPI